MPDELDLTEVDALLANLHWTLDASLVRHMYQMREEIGRLRALVAEEQAKTAHGRAWAEQWRFNAIGDLTSEPTEEPIAAASDGWAVAAPTEEEVNAYFRGGCCDGR